MELAQPAKARSQAVDIAVYRRESDSTEDVAFRADQTVLGASMQGTGALPDARKVPPDEFSTPTHRTIALAIEACVRRGDVVDPLTVLDELERNGQAAECGGVTYLQNLALSIPSAAAIVSHAAIVRAKAKEREIALVRSRIAAAAQGDCPAEELRDRLVSLLGELIPQEGLAATRFPLLTASAMAALPRPPQRIQDVLPHSGLAAVFGAPGSGKSFIVNAMITAIAEGCPFYGHRVRVGRCIYIALEGQAGIPRRVAAWETFHGRSFPQDVLFMFESFRLTEPEDVQGLAAAIDAAGGADVVFIDTLNRAAPGSDENASSDMGQILESVRELQEHIGGLVVLVHHSGKDSARGMRGHSSLFAALDAAIEVTRVEDRREWKVSKSKDGEDGAVTPFKLHVVDLGEDEWGDAVTSCVAVELAYVDGAPLAPRSRPPRGGNQRIMFEALGPLLRESDAFGRGGAPTVRPCVLIEDVVTGTRGRLACETKRHPERARAAITALIASEVLGSGEGWIWLR